MKCVFLIHILGTKRYSVWKLNVTFVMCIKNTHFKCLKSYYRDSRVEVTHLFLEFTLKICNRMWVRIHKFPRILKQEMNITRNITANITKIENIRELFMFHNKSSHSKQTHLQSLVWFPHTFVTYTWLLYYVW